MPKTGASATRLAGDTALAKEARKFKTAESFKNSINDSIAYSDNGLKGNFKNLSDTVQFHGTQTPDKIIQALKDGSIKNIKGGRYGSGLYLTDNAKTAEYFGKQVHELNDLGEQIGRSNSTNKATVLGFDLSGLKIKHVPYDQEYSWTAKKTADLMKKGYDAMIIDGLGETVVMRPEKLKLIDFVTFWNKVNGK